MKIKTCTLTGPALDWAVAKIKKYPAWKLDAAEFTLQQSEEKLMFSTRWHWGGPIVDQEDIEFVLAKEGGHHESAKWMAIMGNNHFGFGEFHLIAAMRCYVIGTMGHEIDIPETLL